MQTAFVICVLTEDKVLVGWNI